MTSSLSNLFEKIKCKCCDCFPEYKCVKDNLIIYKCLSCNKCNSKKLNKELKEKFKNTFRFSNNDINKFILLLRKVFILRNIWMIRKSLMKQIYLKKKKFVVT